MTTLKLKGMSSAAATALEGHVNSMYLDNTARRLIVGELEHEERTEPGPHSGKDRSVSVRVSLLEVPGEAQQEHVRQVMRALYELRTASGTLDEASGRVNLNDSAQKVASAASMVYVEEALEARAMLRETHKRITSLANDMTQDVVKYRRTMRKLGDVLERFMVEGASVDTLIPELANVITGEVADDYEPDDVTETKHDAAEDLAGQDVGTRVPAPEFTPADPEPAATS